MADDAPLVSRIAFIPALFDARAGARAVEAFDANEPGRAFLEGVAGSSPFLARLIERGPEAARAALSSSPEASLQRAISAAWRAADEADPAAQMKALRLAKADAALSLALAEISGAETTMAAADRLSRFADAAVGAAVRMALRQVERLGFRPRNAARPEEGSGLVVLAMGKHGAFELNYSSDIDLVILFDGASEALGAGEARRVAVAAARAIVSRLNDQTADGYVFRTDLRLRPDPGVSAAAVSINAAETYYESYGQNWERAAFIKARACAGDIAVGEEFIRRLRPFIWRKSLDFAAIEEVHAVMRQIHAGKGANDSDFFGADLKRGRGGIREIEFFAQAQQLTAGGKNPALRARGTLGAMEALAAAGRIERAAAGALAERYCALRKIEHRLQMIADEQTHRIPLNEDEATRLAVFLGEPGLEAFEARLSEIFRSTHRLTATLFEPEESQPAPAAFSFTGVDNDPATIAALSALGFQRPEQIADAFRRWHAGETRATRSPRSRALLARITPQLIEALARADAPDDAFAAFDGFLRGLPAGVQIFSLFLNRPDVFERLIRIMTVSPYLAREVARRAWLAEALIESRWPEAALSDEELAQELALRLAAADDYESVLNVVRRWASEESFSISAQLLIDLLSPMDAAARFTATAEAALAALLKAALAETERLYGTINGAVAVIALGRLGARQMTAASDVDLMVIYDAGEEARSTGAARLDAVTYYARLVRRFLAAVTTPTEEGVLYEADLQLRPSGAKGPVAVSLSAFRRYYAADAWTYEIMALTKARVVAGDGGLGATIAREIAGIIAAPRDPARCARDVDAMRERLLAARPATSPWDLKAAVGGFVELDFTVQYLILTHPRAMTGKVPSDFAAAVAALAAAGALAPRQAETLAGAARVYESAHQMSRAALGGVFAPGAAGEAVRKMMAAIFGESAIDRAETRLAALEQAARSVYEEVVLRARDEVGDGVARDS